MLNGKTLFRQKEKKETRKRGKKHRMEKARHRQLNESSEEFEMFNKKNTDNIWPDEENYVGLKEVEREINEQCKEDSIYIDDTFVEKRNTYKSAKELFGDGNRDVVKLQKMLDDEKDKRKNLLKFTNLCVHVIKSKKKCKFCAKF